MFKKLMLRIKSIFTQGHDLIIGVQKEQLRLEIERSEALEKRMQELLADTRWVVSQFDGKCPPADLHKFGEIKKRCQHG